MTNDGETRELTDEEKAEVARIAERKIEIARMGDAYLDELMREVHNEHTMLAMEIARRRAKRTTVLVEFPCTLQELETAIHSYGDHHGFHGKVVVVPASDANDRSEGIGVEEQA